MGEKLGSHELSLDEALARAIKIRSTSFKSDQQPDLDSLKTCVLKKGPRAFKVVKHWTIRNRHTGEAKHHQMTIMTINRTKKHGWVADEEHTIGLSDEESDEIEALFSFLAGLPSIEGEGDHIVINAQNVDAGRFGKVLSAVSTSEQKIGLIEQILAWVSEDPRATEGLIHLASDNPERTKALVAALNYARYVRAVRDFRDLVDGEHPESTYQRFLQENDWMFGSEYSELLTNRELAMGIEVDFPLRRTVDGYLEIFEIKTPLNGKPLFIGTKPLYPRNELNQAIAQAQYYLEKIDRNRHILTEEMGLVVDKVRAKVLIGRNGDTEQQAALRMKCANEARVDIITFDQLIATAERIIEIMVAKNPYLKELDGEQSGSEAVSGGREEPEDLPF